jgi:5-methylcytosine-specific restriction endonuclease McrA
VRGPVRIPTVICKSKYADMPDKTPKLSKRNRRKAIGDRDGKVCQYTGRYAPNGNIDHITPRSKGGKNTWENMVWSDADSERAQGGHDAGRVREEARPEAASGGRSSRRSSPRSC